MGWGPRRKAWSSKKSLSRTFSQEAGISNALPVAIIRELAAFLLSVLYGLFSGGKKCEEELLYEHLREEFYYLLTLHSLALHPLL